MAACPADAWQRVPPGQSWGQPHRELLSQTALPSLNTSPKVLMHNSVARVKEQPVGFSYKYFWRHKAFWSIAVAQPRQLRAGSISGMTACSPPGSPSLT